MTIDEAIIQLRIGPGINEDVSEEYNEAVNMAIEALKAQPCEDEKIIKVSKGTLKARTGRFVIYDVEWLKKHFNTTEAKIYGQPSEDAISRQAVDDAIYDYSKSCDVNYQQIMEFIDKIPSVTPQPKERTEERTETHACDFISREAAIDALWKALHEYEDKTENQFSESKELDVTDWFQHRIFVQNMSDIDRQTILNLPSVVLQPKTEGTRDEKVGHWIEPQQDDGMSDPIYYQVRCSECNFDLDPQTWSQELHQYGADKYYPRCGCRMQEVKNEQRRSN